MKLSVVYEEDRQRFLDNLNSKFGNRQANITLIYCNFFVDIIYNIPHSKKLSQL